MTHLKIMRPFLANCRLLAAVAAAVMLSACAAPPVTKTINDPLEDENRRVHAFNKALDRNVLKPLVNATGGSNGETGAVGRTVGNFASNVDLPRMIVNDVLQANPEDATSNFMRLLINTTFGVAGIFDPATRWGLPVRDSDFGETLHVWGAGEGIYLELPVLGPSTSRDAAGRAVDFVLNPLSYVVPSPERAIMPISQIAAGVSSRGEFGDTVDDILYNSADSYSQVRLLYLQNRRFQLGQTVAEEEIDPFGLDTEGF